MAVNFGLQHQKHFPFIDTLPSGFHKLLHTHTHISIKHHRCFCCIFYLKNFTFLFMSATLSFHAQKRKINKSKRTLRNESTHTYTAPKCLWLFISLISVEKFINYLHNKIKLCVVVKSRRFNILKKKMVSVVLVNKIRKEKKTRWDDDD